MAGGDTQLVGNFEYRIPIAGPVTLAGFFDVGRQQDYPAQPAHHDPRPRVGSERPVPAGGLQQPRDHRARLAEGAHFDRYRVSGDDARGQRPVPAVLGLQSRPGWNSSSSRPSSPTVPSSRTRRPSPTAIVSFGQPIPWFEKSRGPSVSPLAAPSDANAFRAYAIIETRFRSTSVNKTILFPASAGLAASPPALFGQSSGQPNKVGIINLQGAIAEHAGGAEGGRRPADSATIPSARNWRRSRARSRRCATSSAAAATP